MEKKSAVAFVTINFKDGRTGNVMIGGIEPPYDEASVKAQIIKTMPPSVSEQVENIFVEISPEAIGVQPPFLPAAEASKKKMWRELLAKMKRKVASKQKKIAQFKDKTKAVAKYELWHGYVKKHAIDYVMSKEYFEEFDPEGYEELTLATREGEVIVWDAEEKMWLTDTGLYDIDPDFLDIKKGSKQKKTAQGEIEEGDEVETSAGDIGRVVKKYDGMAKVKFEGGYSNVEIDELKKTAANWTVGDKVRCLSDKEGELTKGEIYESCQCGPGVTYVTNDEGERKSYPDGLFKKVSKKEAAKGIHPAVYKEVKKCIEEEKSYEEAKETVKDKIEGWELKKEDYEEMQKESSENKIVKAILSDFGDLRYAIVELAVNMWVEGPYKGGIDTYNEMRAKVEGSRASRWENLALVVIPSDVEISRSGEGEVDETLGGIEDYIVAYPMGDWSGYGGAYASNVDENRKRFHLASKRKKEAQENKIIKEVLKEGGVKMKKKAQDEFESLKSEILSFVRAEESGEITDEDLNMMFGDEYDLEMVSDAVDSLVEEGALDYHAEEESMGPGYGVYTIASKRKKKAQKSLDQIAEEAADIAFEQISGSWENVEMLQEMVDQAVEDFRNGGYETWDIFEDADIEAVAEKVEENLESYFEEELSVETSKRKKKALRDEDIGMPIRFRDKEPVGTLTFQTDVEADYSQENWAEKSEVPYGINVATEPTPKDRYASQKKTAQEVRGTEEFEMDFPDLDIEKVVAEINDYLVPKQYEMTNMGYYESGFDYWNSQTKDSIFVGIFDDHWALTKKDETVSEFPWKTNVKISSKKTAQEGWNIDQKAFAQWLGTKGIEQEAWNTLSDEEKIRFGKEFQGATKEASLTKTSYVKEVPGHKDSKGESAPWCIYSHDTGKLLSSHKTEKEAKEHVQHMYIHKGSIFILTDDIELPTNVDEPEYIKLAKGTKFTITKVKPRGAWTKVGNVKFASKVGVKDYSGEVYFTDEELYKTAKTDEPSNIRPEFTSDRTIPGEKATIQGKPDEIIVFLDGKTTSQLRTMAYDLAVHGNYPPSFDVWRVKMMDRDELKRIITQEIANRSGLKVPSNLNYVVPQSVKHASISKDAKEIIEKALEYNLFRRKANEEDIIHKALRTDVDDIVEAAIRESDIDKEIPLGEAEVVEEPEAVEKFDWRKIKPSGLEIPEMVDEINAVAGKHVANLEKNQVQIDHMKSQVKDMKKDLGVKIKELEQTGKRADKEKKILDELNKLINYIEGSNLTGKVLKYKDLFVTLQEKIDKLERVPTSQQKLDFVLGKLNDLGGMVEVEITEALDDFIEKETKVKEILEKKLSLWPMPEKYKKSQMDRKAQLELVNDFKNIIGLFNEADVIARELESAIFAL